VKRRLSGRSSDDQVTLTNYREGMPVAPDPSESLQQYAHPEHLVTTDWLVAHVGDPGLVVVESDEDVLLYDTGHIPGAVKVDWLTELNDQVSRDYLSGAEFAQLCPAKGIGRDDTIVFYGDSFNWWATFALWVFSLFGHPDVRLLDGGRQKWVAEDRELSRKPANRPATRYPVVERDDAPIRAYRDQVLAHATAGRPLIDVRSPGEYTGELLHMAAYPQEGALRGGHIPGAVNKLWRQAANDDGSFRPADALRATYEDELGLRPNDDVVTYCRIGERSSHTWFVLTHLLGFPRVRNYDGSWTEWGNLVRAPVAHGPQPGRISHG
jgi:thiosulfate/3-mercaptopyruvate sulfurtransferase